MRHSHGTVLITGASSGIGYEFARIFAEKGYDLALVARDRDALSRQARDLGKLGVHATPLPADLSRPQTPQEIFASLSEASIGVEILVNGAGFGTLGPFAEANLDEDLQMIGLNVAALTHLTKLFLKPMIKNGRGKILNIASTAAFQPGPFMAVYYATKAYVLSFSEALAHELRGSGVTVTTLCPGPTATGFQKRSGAGSSRLMGGKFLKIMDPASVARIGYDGLMKGKALVIPGARNRLLAMSVRFTPRGVVTRIAGKLHEKPKS